METVGPVGDQTGEDASCSGVVGTDGGVVEGVVDGRPPSPQVYLGRLLLTSFMCACLCLCSPPSVVSVESQFD